MTDTQIELFRQAVLNALLAGDSSVGLSADAIWVGVRCLGFPKATRDETIEHVEYLQNAGLVKELPKAISKVNRIWRISDAGRRYADEHGF